MMLCQCEKYAMTLMVVYPAIVLFAHLYRNHIPVHLSELYPIGDGDIDNGFGPVYQAVQVWHK